MSKLKWCKNDHEDDRQMKQANEDRKKLKLPEYIIGKPKQIEGGPDIGTLKSWGLVGYYLPEEEEE